MTPLDRACDFVALHPVVTGLGVVGVFAVLSAGAAWIGVGIANGFIALVSFTAKRGRHG